jgi:hypothetical protein
MFHYNGNHKPNIWIYNPYDVIMIIKDKDKAPL